MNRIMLERIRVNNITFLTKKISWLFLSFLHDTVFQNNLHVLPYFSFYEPNISHFLSTQTIQPTLKPIKTNDGYTCSSTFSIDRRRAKRRCVCGRLCWWSWLVLARKGWVVRVIFGCCSSVVSVRCDVVDRLSNRDCSLSLLWHASRVSLAKLCSIQLI